MEKITTKDPEEKDDYILKLTGKAELPEALEIDNNFKIVVQGAITEEKKRDNDRGGRIYTFTFEPVIVEAINRIGKTLKAKDVRRVSQRLRARSFIYWKEHEINEDFELWYSKVGEKMIFFFEELLEFILKKLN